MADSMSLIINKAVGRSKEDLEVLVEDMEQWVNNLQTQTQEEAQMIKNKCEICGSIEKLELHHIAGEKHSYKMITVCYECHQKLSKSQRVWDRNWLKKDLSGNLRDAFFLQGLYDLLILKAEKTCNSVYRMLALQLIEEISKNLGE